MNVGELIDIKGTTALFSSKDEAELYAVGALNLKDVEKNIIKVPADTSGTVIELGENVIKVLTIRGAGWVVTDFKKGVMVI